MANETPTTEIQTQEAPTNYAALASEQFGDEYKGEVPIVEAQEETQEEVQEETQEETEEASTEEVEETEVEQEEEEATISSIQELIETNEWDADWFNTLEVPVKVDGEQSNASLKDLVASYQTQEAASKRLDDAKEKGKALHQEITETQQLAQEQLVVAVGLVNELEKQFDKDSDLIDWQALRKQDPAEWSAKQQEVKDRRQGIDQLKEKALSQWQESTGKTNADLEKANTEHLQAENTKLLEIFPEWAKDEVRQTEQTKIATYLFGKAFTQEEINAASDHRMIELAHKAMLYDAGMAKAEPTKKKLAKVPKMVKSGSPKSEDQINAEARKKQIAKLQKTGSIEDALAVWSMG